MNAEHTILIHCPECDNDFRWLQNSTIKPARCPRCQKLKDFTKIEENKKMLSKASFYHRIYKNKEKAEQIPKIKKAAEKRLDFALKKKRSKKDIAKDNEVIKSELKLKAPSNSNLEKRLDEAWSILVKLKAGNKCEVCRSEKNLNSHHIYSRAKKSVRWSTKNGICLCVGHHIGVTFSAHKTPVEFVNFLMNLRGVVFMQELEIAANATSHLHSFKKEILLNELLKEIKELKKQT